MERGNWIIEFTEDWSQLWSSCNWYTVRFVHVEFENDAALGAWEFVAILLGVGVRIRWNHFLRGTRDRGRNRSGILSGLRGTCSFPVLPLVSISTHR